MAPNMIKHLLIHDRGSRSLSAGGGAGRAPPAAGDERGEHARDAAGRAAHGEVGALLLDQVQGVRLQVLRRHRRYVQQGGEGVVALSFVAHKSRELYLHTPEKRFHFL